MRLYPTLPLLGDEAPVSFISRLALLHGFQKARVFASQLGLHSQRLADGDAAALASLSEMSGASLSDLSRSAITKVGRDYRIRGQALAKKDSHRAHLIVCPRCIAEDLGSHRDGWRTGMRFQWQLEPLRCCHIHDVVLAKFAYKPRCQLFDHASTLQPELGKVLAAADSCRTRPASPLEEYLTVRLEGACTSPWLDSLPWYAAAKASEMLGALLIDGSEALISRYTTEQLINAGSAGFEVASKGPEAIRAGSVDLNSFGSAAKWVSALVMPPPGLATAR